MEKTKKRRLQLLAASVFWLGVWQAAAMAIGQEVFLVSPVQALGTLVQLLPQAEFWQRVAFSAGRILLGFGLGALSSAVLAVAAEKWEWVDALLAPVMQLVKATPVASFIILALVWVSGSSLSVLISFLMVLPVLYGAVRTGIGSADRQLLEMAQVFRLPLGRRLRAVWLPAVLPAFRQGCSVALGICWKSGVAAEVIGLPDGSIGDALYRAKGFAVPRENKRGAALHNVFERLRYPALYRLLFRHSRAGDDPVAVGYHDRKPSAFVQNLGILRRQR